MVSLKMRWFAVLVLAILVLPVACIADPIAGDPMIGQANHAVPYSPSAYVDVYAFKSRPQSSSLFSKVLNPSNTGLTFTTMASDHGFGDVISDITNRTSGWLTTDLKNQPNLTGFSCGCLKPKVLGKPSVGSGACDLQGDASMGIKILKINGFALNSSGLGAVVTRDFTFSINSTRESNPLFLFGFFVGVACYLRKIKYHTCDPWRSRRDR